MPTALTKAAEEALATFKHEDALSIAHRAKANTALDKFLTIVSYGDVAATSPTVPHCVRVWTKWLAENGPATRQHITDATNVKFTERGTPHTLQWGPDLAHASDDSVPENTIIRFQGGRKDSSKRGSPPTIYALWAQRYDVRPLFGVGPERPTTDHLDNHPAKDQGYGQCAFGPHATQAHRPQPDCIDWVPTISLPPPDMDAVDAVDAVVEQQVAALTGVIHPPEQTISGPDGTITWQERAFDYYGDVSEIQTASPDNPEGTSQ